MARLLKEHERLTKAAGLDPVSKIIYPALDMLSEEWEVEL